MSKSKFIPATSKDVRQFFTEHPRLVPEGAHKSVQVSCKGRIKPEAIEVYNKSNKDNKRYSEGNKAHMPLTYRARNHRMVTVHLSRSEIRSLAGKSGTRGPLSAEDLDHAAEAYASAK